MPRLTTFATLLYSFAVFGLILPPNAMLAAAPKPLAPDSGSTRQDVVATKIIRDIALAPGGILQGQLTDAAGQPQTGATVTLSQQKQVLVETKTDDAGRFAIRNIRSGVTQIQVGSQSEVFRLWAPGTAPPSATDGVLVVVQGEVERGQFARDRFPFGTVQPSRRAVILGCLIGAAIFVPLYTGRTRHPSS